MAKMTYGGKTAKTPAERKKMITKAAKAVAKTSKKK
jgi:hypothetical protein